MDFTNIKPKDIIIAPTYLHDNIRKKLLHQRAGVANVALYSLANFLGVQRDSSTYEYYITLQKLQEQLHYQKHSIHSLSFIEELKQVITHMKQYQISLDALPCEDDIHQEIKLIIKTLYPISLSIDQLQMGFKNKLSQLNHVYIVDVYSDIFESELYQIMCHHGATLIQQPTITPQKEWYYTLNKRSEVESIAQYIIHHDLKAEDIKITLLDTTYLPYIKMLFTHYQIPFTLVNDSERSLLQNKFVALLNYYLNPNHEHSIELLRLQLFPVAYQKQVSEYLRLYELTLHDDFTIMQDVHISHDVIDEREIKRLCLLEEKAQQAQAAILPYLQAMEACQDIIDVLCFIDDFLVNTHHFKNNEEKSTVLQIREEIKKADQFLTSKNDLQFFITIIQNIRIQPDTYQGGCQISDLLHPLDSAKYHFILGATQDHYPAMKANEGIFDERFYEHIQYPSLEKRYHLHMQYLQANLHSSQYVIASYPISSFDGNANEASLELEQFFAPLEASKLPLVENHTTLQRTYQISAHSAQQLFLKNNALHGSVSSLERYANCPYAYFLRYGLRIEEPIDYSFSNAKAGTLSHYVLETLATLYGKTYVTTKQAEVEAILDAKVNELIKVYPNKGAQLKQMQERLLHSMMMNLKVLEDHEQNSSLSPTQLEYQINYDIPLEDNRVLHLKGYIDRIDMNADFFRIIDYKSSPKALKEEYVFSALQLQLITYLVIIEKQLQLRPLGAFYYSFANPNINMDYAKLKRRPLGYEIYKESDAFAFLLKEKKLSGWITNEYLEVMDESGSHIKGVRNSKASGVNTSTIYNPDTLSTYMHTIYTLLAQDILSGNIACKSVSGACTYCPYASICGNANHSYTKAELIEVDASLYIKGGRKNA